MPEDSSGNHPRSTLVTTVQSRRALLTIVAVGFALRALCAFLFNGMIDAEGAEYARIAENILSGTGYAGIATEGVQLFFPPLFPMLIAGVSTLGFDVETSGRVVNVLSGALLALPVYGIAKRMFDDVHGLVAAGIVAVHPFLVSLSTTVYCETTYSTLILAAILMAMRSADRADLRTPAGAGLLYGLAYLIRPEGLVFMLVGATFLVAQRALSDRGDFARRAVEEARRAAVMAVCFALLAAPYVIWLSSQTGRFSLQTKSILNGTTERRMQSGLTWYAAGMAVGSDLAAEGVWNQPNLHIITRHRASISGSVKSIVKKSIDVLRNASIALGGSIEFGSPALFALAVVGLVSYPRKPRSLLDLSHSLALLCLSGVALYFIYYSVLRFYVLFLLFFCIWASAGLLRITFGTYRMLAGDETSRPLVRSLPRAQTIAACLRGGLVLAAVLVPAWLFAVLDMVGTRRSRPIEALAETFAAGTERMTIADVSTPFSFHAKADFVWLPFCDERTALAYLASKQVTHVVVNGDQVELVPYLSSWLQNGVPGAQMVAKTERSNGTPFYVFRLQQAPSIQ